MTPPAAAAAAAAAAAITAIVPLGAGVSVRIVLLCLLSTMATSLIYVALRGKSGGDCRGSGW